MRIGRALIIPSIVALGVAGSALVGSALPAVAANAPVVQAHKTGPSTSLMVYHHGTKVYHHGLRVYHHG